MAFIKVTPEELESQASQIANGAAQVDQLLTQLLNQVSDLAGRWEGAGSAAFQGTFDTWHKGAAMTKEGMDGMTRFLNSAATSYRDTDTAIGQAGS